MPIHLRELRKGTRFMLMRTGDKFAYHFIGRHRTGARPARRVPT